jgi:hypothetical protein
LFITHTLPKVPSLVAATAEKVHGLAVDNYDHARRCQGCPPSDE